MLRAINETSRVKSRPTWDTKEKSRMLLDYAETYLDAILHYKLRGMILHVDSDAAYLTTPEARSCYAVHFYLSDRPSPRPIKPNPERNDPIHTEFKTIHNVVSSISEAETCGNFNNRKTYIFMWPALITLEHKQPATHLITENYTTEGFVNLGMKTKSSKTWDMKWHWLRDKYVIDQLRVYWDKVTNNDANYFTKHHPPIHHRQMRPRYIHTSNLVRTVPQTIRLYEGVLNRVPGTQSHVKYLRSIRAKQNLWPRNVIRSDG